MIDLLALVGRDTSLRRTQRTPRRRILWSLSHLPPGRGPPVRDGQV